MCVCVCVCEVKGENKMGLGLCQGTCQLLYESKPVFLHLGLGLDHQYSKNKMTPSLYCVNTHVFVTKNVLQLVIRRAPQTDH